MTDTANASPASPPRRLFLVESALIFVGLLAIAVAIVAGPLLNPPPGVYVQFGEGAVLVDTRSGQMWRRNTDTKQWTPFMPEVNP